MDTNKLYAVHIQGMMSARETILVTALTPYHAIDKIRTTFSVTNDVICIKMNKGFCKLIDGKFVRAYEHDIATQVAKVIIKF